MSKIRQINFSIEGSIGSGKSKVLEYLETYQPLKGKLHIIPEPISLWTNFKGHNLLQNLYQDPVKNSFSFQTYVQLTSVQSHLKEVIEPIKITERSIYSARHCFVEQLYYKNCIQGYEYSILNEWYQFLIKNLHIKIDDVIYLQTKPEVVFSRIIKRNRVEEKDISLEYLQEIHLMHEKWLNYQTIECPLPYLVHTVNANLTFKEVIDCVINILTQKLSTLSCE